MIPGAIGSHWVGVIGNTRNSSIGAWNHFRPPTNGLDILITFYYGE